MAMEAIVPVPEDWDEENGAVEGEGEASQSLFGLGANCPLARRAIESFLNESMSRLASC